MVAIILIDESNQTHISDEGYTTEYRVTTIIDDTVTTNVQKSNTVIILPDISSKGDRTYWINDDTKEQIDNQMAVTSDITVRAVWENDADSFKKLYDSVKTNTPIIRITSDIAITSTIYVDCTTNIFSDTDRVIYRDSDFIGDLFVIGENEKHEKTILKNRSPILTLGNNNCSGTLTLNGMRVESNGSAITLVHSGQLNMYDDVIIRDFNKVSNDLLLSDRYFTSYPENIGGAAIANIGGLVNIYGGCIMDNASNIIDGEPAYCGGAIYNYGHLKMYGGTIKNNEASRGGAIFNYRMLDIEAGTIENNSATKYAGAIYCANSQYVNVWLGKANSNLNTLVIENNVAQQAGGVLFAKTNCSIVVLGGTTFKNNQSINSHGGVFYIAGTLTIKDALFENNKAGSQGGAIQIHSENDSELTPRDVHIENTIFSNNKAKNGGALYNVTLGNLTVNSCDFQNNSATNNGGALYLYTSTNSTFDDVKINNNTAASYGGALYMSGESNATFTNISSTGNSAKNGGFMYITTTNTVVTLLTGNITSNNADNGSFFFGNSKKCYIYLGSTLVYDGTKANKYTEYVI